MYIFSLCILFHHLQYLFINVFSLCDLTQPCLSFLHCLAVTLCHFNTLTWVTGKILFYETNVHIISADEKMFNKLKEATQNINKRCLVWCLWQQWKPVTAITGGLSSFSWKQTKICMKMTKTHSLLHHFES